MQLPENKSLLSLLVKIYNETVRDYYYFPDIIYAGNHRIEKTEMILLLNEGYIKECDHDSFGRFYKSTKKCELLIHDLIIQKLSRKRKQAFSPALQSQFEF
jgi:hypothetical protein